MKMFHVEHSKRIQISRPIGWITALIILAITITAHGQYVTLIGKLQGANGLPAANDIISFTPSQTFYISGVTPLVVVPATAQCATSIDGTVVGVPNPLNPPQVSAVYSGTLPAGNYFVEIVWYDAVANVTLASPEVEAQLTGSGEIQVNPPVSGMPANAVGAKVYIGTSSGGETLQGSVAGSGTFTQSTPLATGAALPATNTTICQIIANDAGWPTGTGYEVGLTTPAGATMPGYPMQWQLLGPGSTINLGNGLPLYNGIVIYPPPLLAIPYNHGTQSMSSNLSLTNYNLLNVGKLGVGTATPIWGVDVEGSGANGIISAKGGYLVNGLAGTTGQGLCSDGTYYDAACTFLTTLPTFYYQTVALNGTAKTQRPTLNFSSRFTATDSASPAETTIDLPITGVTAGSYTNTSLTVDVYGRITTASSGGTGSFTSGNNSYGYWVTNPIGWTCQQGSVASGSTGTVVTFPKAFTNASSVIPTTTSLWPGSGGISFVSVEGGSVTTAGFQVAMGVSSTQAFNWTACGY